MKHLLVCVLLFATQAAADPISDLRERYAKFEAVRYRLIVSERQETHELKVTWVRGAGYRVEAPVELLVVKGGRLRRCATHGMPNHVHMVEDYEHERGEVPGNELLTFHDVVLRLLENLELPGNPMNWTQRGTTLSGNGQTLTGGVDPRQTFTYELDKKGLLAQVKHRFAGSAQIDVAEFNALSAAPEGALSLGEPTPSKPWHEIAQAYVAPRIRYRIRATTTSTDTSLRWENTVTGVYSSEQGFHVHVGAQGGRNPESSRLAVSDHTFVWTSPACTNTTPQQAHGCKLSRERFDAEWVGYEVFSDDFVLAANLGARGLGGEFNWTGPWSKLGKRWRKHGEVEGSLVEATFDDRGRLELLRSVSQHGSLHTTWELVTWEEPRELEAAVFEPDLKVHRRPSKR